MTAYKLSLSRATLTHITMIRERAERVLNSHQPLVDETKKIKLVANNREMYAIMIEAKTRILDSEPEVFFREVVSLALLRHGQPGWRGDASFQPQFSDLPVIA